MKAKLSREFLRLLHADGTRHVKGIPVSAIAEWPDVLEVTMRDSSYTIRDLKYIPNEVVVWWLTDEDLVFVPDLIPTTPPDSPLPSSE